MKRVFEWGAFAVTLVGGLGGCVYYNTYYNAQERYVTALESREKRKDAQAEADQKYWRELQEWLASGGSGSEVLAQLDTVTTLSELDSTARADSLWAFLSDSLDFSSPLSISDSLELQEAFGVFDSLSAEQEKAQKLANGSGDGGDSDQPGRPRRPKHKAFQKNVPSEERLLDACVTKCAKVISLYPDSKWRDDAIMLMGKALYEKRSYNDALTKFEELRLYYGDGELVAEARLYQARTLAAVERMNEAELTYRELLHSGWDPLLRQQAGVELADLLRASGDPAGASLVYEELMSDRSLARDRDAEVLLGWGRALLDAGDPSGAVAAFDRVETVRHRNEERVEAFLASGRALALAGLPAEAERRFASIAEDERLFQLAALAALELGLTRVRLGEIESAEEAFRVVVERYPGSAEAGQALMQLAALYRDEYDDLARARRTLQLAVVEVAGTEDAEKARTMLTDIERYQRLRRDARSLAGVSGQRARFLLSEHQLIKQGRVAEAEAGYRSLIDGSPESAWRPRADMAIAWILASIHATPARADSVYAAVADQYPGTLAAAVSSARLGRPVPEVTIIDADPLEIPPEPPTEPAEATESEPSGGESGGGRGKMDDAKERAFSGPGRGRPQGSLDNEPDERPR